MTDVCPACGSDDVYVGNRVLSCLACGWHYLNAHPCRVCGGPATGVMGGTGGAVYGCRDHPFTAAERATMWAGFVAAIKQGGGA